MHRSKNPPASAVGSVNAAFLFDENVEYRLPDVVVDFQILELHDVLTTVPWHIADSNIRNHWDKTGGGRGVRVAVLDTGVQGPSLHPETSHAVKEVLSTVGDSGYDRGRSSHGQHVAGLIAGKAVGGSPNAEIISIKVLRDNGSGDDTTVTRGIYAAINAKADIINMSLGAPAASRQMYAALVAAMEAGIICVAATGNDNRDRLLYPAAFTDVCLAVGAVDRNLRRAAFSNYGRTPQVDLVDYGVQVVSSVIGNGYQRFSGTSMATPVASSKIANYISYAKAHNAWSGDIREKYYKLEQVCKDLHTPGRDNLTGWGIISPDKAFSSRLWENRPGGPTTPETPGSETTLAKIVRTADGQVRVVGDRGVLELL